MRQYIGISRDHSASMFTLANPAMKDYNQTVETIKEAAQTNNVETFLSVVKCGAGRGSGRIESEYINTNVNLIPKLLEYQAMGSSTPLFNSVGSLIESMKKVPDYNDPDTSIMIMAVTDGQDNDSALWPSGRLAEEIATLQATDKWTFIFRVPKGYKTALVRMGIPEGNILEWELSQRGIESATQATTSAFNEFYEQKAKGIIKSTRSFYKTDLSNVSKATIASAMNDITLQCNIINVLPLDDDMAISNFIKLKTGKDLIKGCAFYELMKYEREVQDYKKICIQDKTTGVIYGGDSVRNILGLPTVGSCSISPGQHGNYKIFVQSTSLNRKVKSGTNVLYWTNAND